MSERDVAALLDRVAAHTPPMDVEIPHVVGIGRTRRRRRRQAGAGMTLAGLCLAGGLWWGMGQGGLLGAADPEPAGGGSTLVAPRPLTIGGVQAQVGPTADGRRVRVIWPEGSSWGVESSFALEDLGGGPQLQAAPADAAYVVARVPDGTPAEGLTPGIDVDGSLRWVDDVRDGMVVDLAGPESVVLLVLERYPDDAVDQALGADRPLVLGTADGSGGVAELAVPVGAAGSLAFWVEGGEISVTEDLRPLEPGSLELPGGPEDRIYLAADGRTAYVVENPVGPALTVENLVQEEGLRTVRPELAQHGQVELSRDVEVDGRSFTVGVLAPGVRLLALASSEDDGTGWTWLGSAADEQVATTWSEGLLTVDTARGLYLLQPGEMLSETFEGIPYAGRPGEGVIYEAAPEPGTHRLYAVLPLDARPELVAEPSVVLAQEQLERFDEAGVVVWSATVTLPEELSVPQAVQGVRTAPEGRVLPLYTAGHGPQGDVVTMLGEQFVVSHEDGRPVLTSLLDGTELTVGSGITDHSVGEGQITMIPGYEPADVDEVILAGVPEHLERVRDHVVLRGWRGPVTVLALTPTQRATYSGFEVLDTNSGQRRALP